MLDYADSSEWGADAERPGLPEAPKSPAGSFLRELRERRRLTRAQAANLLHMQANSLGSLENGNRPVRSEFVDQVAAAWHLSGDEERHLRHLAEAGGKGKAAANMPDYAFVITEEMQVGLDGLLPHAAAWVDPYWRVLASNSAYRRAYPGLEEAGNVLTWFFRHPESKLTMLDWEGEAALTVAWFRALIGEHGCPSWANDLLRDLSDSDDFMRLWTSGSVTFNRRSPYMHLRNSRSGEPYTLLVQITRSPGNLPPMQHFLGVLMSYNGSDELADRRG
ncbi:helix-turn-helix domain-containing protein [Nocardia sp. CA-128927]|uniref:MmyB family transcriptional regulator n=1 Tax=Nocardia sp. CA-128927 TaxID=3239975 RepID=UPI003D994742